jgi:leucine-zipper of insertion element IS481
MNLHANSRTCPRSRLLLCWRVVEQGWNLAEAAEAAGCSDRTASKWIALYRDGDRELLVGRVGLIAALRGCPSSVCGRSRRSDGCG